MGDVFLTLWYMLLYPQGLLEDVAVTLQNESRQAAGLSGQMQKDPAT